MTQRMSASDLRLSITERDFQTKILDLAAAQGWLRHHTRPALTRSGGYATPIQGDAGFLDLVLARRGWVHIWEVKTEKGRLTVAQRVWLRALTGEPWSPGEGGIAEHGVGFTVGVVRPSMWDQIVEELR